MDKTIGNPLIVGLDWLSEADTIATIRELNKKVHAFKLSVRVLEDRGIIERIRNAAGSVNLFLDLQLVGTDRYIYETVLLYSCPEVRYITVNAVTGPASIKAACRAAKISRILVGTILSSLDIATVNLIFGTVYREVKTHALALMAKEAGAYGMFCSSEELDFLSRQAEIRDFCKVAVGIRPEWHPDRGYHSYVMTPREAMRRGADFFVIGSLITTAEMKVAAVEMILAELSEAKGST